ncbi:hypothetical protein [Umezawaea beigongshangensis]|uniref:hypothetical protein n=1 Tax=Umezawaea beigongshangensis TaxID=2780383 RepID=UPI0027DE358E|nr:hypothetical protein [Umezawaea beigongshangensis]
MIGAARHRAPLAAVVAATLLVGLAVAVFPPSTGVPATGSAQTVELDARRSAVADLLDTRARALLHRDETAFLATVDPSADEVFRDAQRALFGNLAGVPLEHWSYRLDARSADVTGLHTADELWAPPVTLEYALRGADLAPTSRPLAYLFARHGDRWYLASDTALERQGLRTWRGPWDFGPCLTLSSAVGLVLGRRGGEALAARVLAELGPAVAAVTEVWGTGWAGRVAVVVPSGVDEMQTLVGPGFAVGSAAAVAVADRVDNGAARGQRVVLNPAVAPSLSQESLRVVLRHEITHVAARAATTDGAPLWLLEGFADHVGYRGGDVPLAHAAPDLAELVRSGGVLTIPERADFRSARTMDLAYQEAWTLCDHLAERLGEPGLVALYRRLAVVPESSASAVETVLREETGLDLAALTAGWREFVTARLG